ncbi:alpha/beta fold hydrolase [Teichococcus vastitatis]|uniref:histidine kinase n=1 Tax=Teichococcus vastitatis TaxID=2307076 RepID=A0ABS9W777_9PROT|nr:alpha/beta fold hydrolase [Pseudoroseomonas vastitatis]MCI0755066.1 alpha/beta fold hydrolase [Pseudoroseomonas vastitatis]
MSQLDALARHNVRFAGAGSVTLVFGHGYGCDQSVWRFVSPAFEAGFRTAVFDYVGAGGSRCSFNAGRYGELEGYAEDLLEVCRACGPGPVVFIGHSVSAMIGVLAAKREPERFLRLILVAPSACYLNDAHYVGGFTEDDIDALLDLLDTDRQGWAATMAATIMGHPERPDLARELAASFCRMDPAVARHFARVTFTSDNRADLPQMQTRTLVLQCSQDAIVPEAAGEYVHRHLPRSEWVRLATTGHCPHLSAPDEVVVAIRAFLADLHPATAGAGAGAGAGSVVRGPLRVSQDSADEIYEQAPCGYLSFLIDGGTVVRINATFAQWIGGPASGVVGSWRFQDLLTTASRIVYETRMVPLLRIQGRTDAAAMEITRADGRGMPLLVSAAVKADASGRPSLVRVTALDATAYRRQAEELVRARNRAERAEAAARQAQAAAEAADAGKTRFLAAMNHEFRTPISIISGFSELLLERPGRGVTEDARQSYLADIRAAADHLLELLEDATRYSKLDAAVHGQGRRRSGLHALLKAGLRLAGPSLKKAGMNTVVAAEPDHAALVKDPGSVAEAIACVLRELARRASSGSTTQIRSRHESGYAFIDMHCGALQSSLGPPQDPLQAAGLHSRGLHGAGLGMAVAERVLRLQGGRLQSREFPGGACLSIRLPA